VLKRLSAFACAISLCLVFNTVAYGSSVSQLNTNDSVEILSPKVGTQGDLVLKKEKLYINVRINSDKTVYMTLYKVDPAFYLGDGKADASDSVDIPSNVDSLSDDQKQAVRPAVYAKYLKVQAALSQAQNDLASAKKRGDQSLIQKASVASNSCLGAYNSISPIYDKLFTRAISGPTEAKVSDVLPYFKAELDGVKPGTYKLVFTADKPYGKIIKALKFNVATPAETVEKIKDAVPDNMNQLLSTP